MSDLIERDKAMKVAMWFGTSEQKYHHSFIKKRVMEIPSARPKGEWIKDYNGNGWNDYWDYTCSNCGKKYERADAVLYKSNFCPNCSADMREREGE